MTMKATVKTLAAIVAMVATSATLPARADTVTADAALAAAKGWVNLRQSMDGGALSAPESAKAYPGADGKGTYYVVSLSGGGYVVTSGDTFLKPVLSYAASGAWEEDEAKNPLVLFVKCDVAASAAAMPETGSAVASANAAEWAKLAAAQKGGAHRLAATAPTADLRVAPLLTTSWSQGSVGGALCYNYYTPSNYVCGCAATAMAQVMKYFRYPTAKVTAGEGYYDSVNYDGTDVGWNMDGYFASATATTKTPWDEGDHPAFGGPYDWDAMVDSPTSSTSETARKAIGQICRDAGLTVFAHYNVNNSVCLGSAKVRKPKDDTFEAWIEYWEQMFWKSEFSHILGSNPINGNLAVITKKCIKEGCPFPMELLIRNKTTLSNLLKQYV